MLKKKEVTSFTPLVTSFVFMKNLLQTKPYLMASNALA